MIVIHRSHLPVAAGILAWVLFAGLSLPVARAKEALGEKDRERIGKELRDLTGEVKMVMFTQELECQYCAQTHEMLETLASLSDKLELTVFDLVRDREEAEAYGVDKIPATILLNQTDVGIRYYGVPAGYELAALVETIEDLSADTTNLADESREKLKTLSNDVHIQVFVTPTCPYCPGAARTAYALAQENPRIRADVVEAIEFPHLANKYHVRGVPTVVINDTISFVGNRPESYFVEQILKATE